MISHKHKFIFIAVPKTGSRSIRTELNINSEQWHTRCSFHNAEELRNYFRFTIVRNPWARLLSVFCHYAQIKKKCEHYEKTKDRFSEFIKGVHFDESDNWNKKDKTTNLIPNYMLFTQKYWLDGNIDFIGRFEDLQKSFDTICDQIKLPRQKLPHHHKSDHKHYTEYYDDEAREIVAEKYAKDIEYFGYKFGE